MIKVVLFDYGGVLSEAGKAGGIPKVLGKLYDIPPSQIDITDMHSKFLVGGMSAEHFFDELNRRYGGKHQINATDFTASNADFAKRCLPIYDLASRLRVAGIRTGVLSDVYGISAQQLREAGCYEGFEPVLLSCEQRSAKPSRATYKHALQKLGVSAHEVLFIDDQARCMPPADLGIQTILATSPEQIVRDVGELLRKENGIELQ